MKEIKKIICIGDLHGKDIWRTIDLDNYDRVIFMGDYVDSYDDTDEDIIKNLKAVIRLRKKNPEKVVLLIGNHDIQYFVGKEHMRCSGYRESYADEVQKLFTSNDHFFNHWWMEGDFNTNHFYLFSHAGFSATFCRQNNISVLDSSMLSVPDYLCLESIGRSRGGSANHGGIYWADQTELVNDYLGGVHQVVGHSKMKDITRFGGQDGSVTFIDVLDKMNKFYEIDIIL